MAKEGELNGKAQAQLNRVVCQMDFHSATPTAVLAIPAVAADVAFPSVVVAGIPSGATILSAMAILVIGALLDTSAAENQVASASKTLRVKKSTGAWGTDDVVALTFSQNALECKASEYGGGRVLFGGTDVSSKVTGNGTYNFRSEETNRSDAVTATGASLELLDVVTIIRVLFAL
jgi:hypothetical protein